MPEVRQSRASDHLASVAVMRHTQANLERAKRHIVDAEKHVVKQQELVNELERDGRTATEAHEMLQAMVDLLDEMRAHADEIAKEAKH